MTETDQIKKHLEAGQQLARLRDKLNRRDFRGITIDNLKNLDPDFRKKLLKGAYHQVLKEEEVDYIKGFI